MEVDVKAEGLDALVTEYLVSEGLVDGRGAGEDASSKELHDMCEAVRQDMLNGDVLKAMEAAKRVAPHVIEDQRLLFRLQKQHFIELLRRGDKAAALAFCRAELAPCAAHAYPEAYQEFKQAMLALVYPADSPGPVAEEWSMDAREELAGMLYQTLRHLRGVKDARLVILLTYLIHIRGRYFDTAEPGQHVLQLRQPETALLPDGFPMDQLPLPKLDGRATFPETDVQSLAQAVGISRQSSIAALRHTDGDLSRAFWNELGRRRVNRQLLNSHCYEYACYRGLLALAGGGGGEAGAAGGEGPGDGAGRDPAPDGRRASGGATKRGKESPLWEVGGAAGGGGGMRAGGDDEQGPAKRSKSSSPRSDGDEVGEGEAAAMDVDGGGEGAGGSHSCVAKPCLVWRGPPPPRPPDPQRPPSPAPMVEGDDDEGGVGGGGDGGGGGGGGSGGSGRKGDPPPPGGEGAAPGPAGAAVAHEDALRLLTLASEGLTDKVAEGVRRLDPEFFRSNPRVLFELKRCEFTRLLAQGRPAEALAIARADLGPLSLGCPQLLRALKDTLVAIAAPAGAGAGAGAGGGEGGATALQAALVSSLGLEEPALLRMLRRLLGAHTRWFRLQRCADPHFRASGVEAVKGSPLPRAGGEGEGPEADAPRSDDERDSEEGAGGGSGDGGESDEEGDEDDEDGEGGDVVFTETGILTLMEFLAVSRADAIQLLQQYQGSPELALAHIIQ